MIDPTTLGELILPYSIRATTTSTTIVRDHSEALDWLHGGTPESCVVRTLRSTSEALGRLKEESFDGSDLEEKSCMVCLEGFVQQDKRASRLSCSHLFHFECVSKWLKFDHRCPVCRSPMPWIRTLFHKDGRGCNNVVDNFVCLCIGEKF